jgi:hypothetical protein
MYCETLLYDYISQLHTLQPKEEHKGCFTVLEKTRAGCPILQADQSSSLYQSSKLLVYWPASQLMPKADQSHLSINPVNCWFIGQPANSCHKLTNPHLSINLLNCWFIGQPANSCQKLTNPCLSINPVNCWLIGQSANTCHKLTNPCLSINPINC